LIILFFKNGLIDKEPDKLLQQNKQVKGKYEAYTGEEYKMLEASV